MKVNKVILLDSQVGYIMVSVTQVVSCRCQLQALLRLELCRLFSSEQVDSLDPDQMAEEVGYSLLITV